MRILLLTICLTFSACKRDNKSVETDVSSEVAAKKAFYCSEGKRVFDEIGFMDDKCDSLLYTSLWSASCLPELSIQDWEDPDSPGKWHRNPQRDCFLDGKPNGAASSISRDMMLGLWHKLVKNKDLANVKDLIEYGKKNNWVMGEAKDNETLVSRAMLSPQLISLLYDIESKLSGANLTGEKDKQVELASAHATYLVTGSYLTTSALTETQTNLLQDFLPIQESDDALPINTGFRAHLDILRIHLSGLVRGGITDGELETIKAQIKRQPRNALFAAVGAKYGVAKATTVHALLFDESIYPADRLPTTKDRCIGYINARNQESDDWKPCPNEGIKEHDGTDLVFAASIIDGTFP
jgi:hypothetical protein